MSKSTNNYIDINNHNTKSNHKTNNHNHKRKIKKSTENKLNTEGRPQ